MGGARRGRRLGGIVAAVFGGLLVLAMADRAQAQTAAGGAEIKQMTGRVEVLRKGQNEWGPVTTGAKLVDGDQIRAHAGASAELGLPDGSTLFLAENSRLAMTKVEFDEATKSRTGAFHLVVGKVRALVSKAAIQLIRSRQSNFVISTPTAVAAARGTHYEVTYDAAEKVTRVAVLPDPRFPEAAEADHDNAYAFNQKAGDRF